MRQKDTLHRQRIQKFLKTTIEIRRKPEHRSEIHTSFAEEAKGRRPQPGIDLPLFTEIKFRVKEHDPL